MPPETERRLTAVLGQMWSLAVHMGLPGVDPKVVNSASQSGSGEEQGGSLSAADAERLVEAARLSHNRQLKYIVALLMLSKARPGEILKAQWPHIDLEQGVWRIPMSHGGRVRTVALTQALQTLLSELPRWDDCPYLIANPNTRRPYSSLARSWDAVRIKAGLPYIELDDLRYCNLGVFTQHRLLEIGGPEAP
jgi:integrase